MRASDEWLQADCGADLSAPAMLTADQIERFQRDGAIVAENAVTPDQLAALRREFEAWVEASRTETAAFDIETPVIPKGASFFAQQAGTDQAVKD